MIMYSQQLDCELEDFSGNITIQNLKISMYEDASGFVITPEPIFSKIKFTWNGTPIIADSSDSKRVQMVILPNNPLK